MTKNADIALYRAKEQGKNNYQIYTASMNIATYKTFLLEKDLRKAIIQMAKGLNMKIVAEGVEKTSQLSFLKQQDCDEIQGYLFSAPAPVDDFLKLLSKRRLRPGTSDLERGNTFENRRQYYRIHLYFPLSSEMTILKINDKNINGNPWSNYSVFRPCRLEE